MTGPLSIPVRLRRTPSSLPDPGREEGSGDRGGRKVGALVARPPLVYYGNCASRRVSVFQVGAHGRPPPTHQHRGPIPSLHVPSEGRLEGTKPPHPPPPLLRARRRGGKEGLAGFGWAALPPNQTPNGFPASSRGRGQGVGGQAARRARLISLRIPNTPRPKLAHMRQFMNCPY